MDLSEALGDWPGNNQGGGGSGGAWPGQPPNPMWPGGAAQPSAPSGWPGAPSGPGQPGQPAWPGAPSGPGQPAWPSPGPGQPAWPGAPSGPGQPSQPAWPGAPSGPGQPSQPAWPGAPSGPGQPSQPAWPGAPSGPGQPGQPWNPSGPEPRPSLPQQNLMIPFKQNFPQGLRENMTITISGTIKPHPNKFTVDLCSGSNIAFHFNPRFNENGKQVIVRNSMINKQWGREERELRHFPFTAGRRFEMKIHVTSRFYKVDVNGSTLFQFNHRVSGLKSIDRMNVYNDLTLSDVRVD